MSTFAGSQASNSMSSVPSSSIRKKRIACDNCHLSKVRCTGETSGCQRCERGHKTCHYSESNMGRVPAGGVSKRRKPSAQTALDVSAATALLQQQQRHASGPASPFESVNSYERQSDQEHASSSAVSDGRESSDHFVDDSLNIWGDPSDPSKPQEEQQLISLLENTGSELDSLQVCFDPLISTFDDIEFSDVEDGHFEVEEDSLEMALPQLFAAQTPRSSPSHSRKQIQARQQQPQPHPQMTPPLNTPASSISQGYQDSNCTDSQAADMANSSTDGIRYWTSQLEGLFGTLLKNPIPLDGMLHHSSQLLPRTMGALRSLHSADVPSSATSLVLILVCLTEAVALFEQCVPSVLADRSTATSSYLSLRLGDFQVDRKAQQALQMHIVGKELSSMMQASQLIRQTLRRPEWSNISKRTHELLLEDLRLRTVTLIYQMKQARGPSRMLAS